MSTWFLNTIFYRTIHSDLILIKIVDFTFLTLILLKWIKTIPRLLTSDFYPRWKTLAYPVFNRNLQTISFHSVWLVIAVIRESGMKGISNFSFVHLTAILISKICYPAPQVFNINLLSRALVTISTLSASE